MARWEVKRDGQSIEVIEAHELSSGEQGKVAQFWNKDNELVGLAALDLGVTVKQVGI